jgi:hypothetical protein
MVPPFLEALQRRVLAALAPAAPAPLRPLDLEEARPRLLPKVRLRHQYETFDAGRGGSPVATRPLAGSFARSLVVDFPAAELDVTAAHLQGWGADFDLLALQARTNLLALGGEEGFAPARGGFHRSTWEDGLAGSRILLPGILRRLPVAGDPVALLPRKDVLLVVGDRDPAGLCRALELALELADGGPEAMIACPLRLEGFAWAPFHVGDDHPAAPLLARARGRRLLEEYAHQKALLDGQHRRAGRRIAVAPYRLERGPSGELSSFTLWTPGPGECWLPEADHLLLAGREGPRIPWSRVRRVLGHLLEPLGLRPERHRLTAPPGREALEALEAGPA